MIIETSLVPDNSLRGENLSALTANMEHAKYGHYASYMCERIINAIKQFESDMPDNLIAGGRMVSSGDVTFSIEDVRYRNPDMIIFCGKLPNGEKVQLVQHTTQLNLLLVSVPRLDTSNPRRQIGFVHDYEPNIQEEK